MSAIKIIKTPRNFIFHHSKNLRGDSSLPAYDIPKALFLDGGTLRSHSRTDHCTHNNPSSLGSNCRAIAKASRRKKKKKKNYTLARIMHKTYHQNPAILSNPNTLPAKHDHPACTHIPVSRRR